jgi:hypothetical protein
MQGEMQQLRARATQAEARLGEVQQAAHDAAQAQVARDAALRLSLQQAQQAQLAQQAQQHRQEAAPAAEPFSPAEGANAVPALQATRDTATVIETELRRAVPNIAATIAQAGPPGAPAMPAVPAAPAQGMGGTGPGLPAALPYIPPIYDGPIRAEQRTRAEREALIMPTLGNYAQQLLGDTPIRPAREHTQAGFKTNVRAPEAFGDDCIRRRRDPEVFLADYELAMSGCRNDPLRFFQLYLSGALRDTWWQAWKGSFLKLQMREPTWEEAKAEFLRVAGVHHVDKQREARQRLRNMRMGSDTLQSYAAYFRLALMESGPDAFGKAALLDMFLEGLTPELVSRMGIDRNGETWKDWESAEKAAIAADKFLRGTDRLNDRRPRAAPLQALQAGAGAGAGMDAEGPGAENGRAADGAGQVAAVGKGGDQRDSRGRLDSRDGRGSQGRRASRDSRDSREGRGSCCVPGLDGMVRPNVTCTQCGLRGHYAARVDRRTPNCPYGGRNPQTPAKPLDRDRNGDHDREGRGRYGGHKRQRESTAKAFAVSLPYKY